MKRILPLFLAFVALLSFGLQFAYAQATLNSISGAGGDLYPDRKCAPVDAKFNVRFASTDQFDKSRLQIKIDWGNGVIDYFNGEEIQEQQGTEAGNPPFLYYVEKINTYVDGGEKCEYFPTGYLYVDGVESNEKVTRNLVVWDKDDANGGEIVIAPTRFLACPGQEFTVTFDDASEWNCTPPEVTDKTNKFSRWTRFTYGTVEKETGTSRIGAVKVGGAVRGYPYKGDVKEHIYTEGGPGVISPNHQSLAVTVPADARVGEIFEIKLENWNMCNPYDPADESNAVFNYAYIEIVAPPVVDIVSEDNVCPETAIDFSAVESSNVDDNSLLYSWEVFDDEEGKASLTTGYGADYTFGGFATSGKKLVRLTVERTDLGDDFFCQTVKEKLVTVQETPGIESFINSRETQELSFCFDGESSSQQVNYKFKLYRYSTNEYAYKLSAYAVNSSSDTPDGDLIHDWTVVSAGDVDPKEVLYSPVYAQPGKYRVQIAVKDKLTGCIRYSESVTIIYDEPVADFTFDNLCVGQATAFKDASTLGAAINGDKIIGWAWDFTNDGLVDETAQDPSYTYAVAGTYNVALEVETQGGCKHRVVKEVEVHPVPEASLGYDYTDPVCPGESVVFKNLSLINNTAALFPDGVAYTLLVSDGTDIMEVAFTEDTYTYSFENTSSGTLTYTIWIKAKAGTSNCENLSDPLQVQVKPGAKADFHEPKYNPIATNCAPVDLNFVVNQATLDLNATSHNWIIKADGQELLNKTFVAGEEGYDTLPYVATNTRSARLLYEVTLIAKKEGTCIQPAVHNYQVAPVPAVEDFPVTVEESCDTTRVHVKVADLAGIMDLHWNISPQSANHASVNYDDEFTLIYLRPGRNDPAFQVDMSLVKENYFGCQSEETKKQVNILPQVIDDVELQLLSTGTEGCSPLTVGFNNTTNAPAGTTYELYIKHGTAEWEAAGLASAEIDDNFSYTFTAPGSYLVRLKATLDGCSRFSPSTTNLVVYDDPQPNFALDKAEGCAGFTASFIKNIQGSQTNTWTITDLTTGAVDGPFSNLETYDFGNDSDVLKTYEVRLKSVSDKNCEADSSLQVKVYPAATADFNLLNADACAPYEVVVENISQNPAGTTYTWNWDDGSITTSTDTELRHTYANSSYSSPVYKNITLTATTADGCTSVIQKQLILQPQVLADVLPSVTEGCAPLQLYFRNYSQGATAHSWEITNLSTGAIFHQENDSYPTIPDLTNNTNQPVVYQVRYVALNASTGCSDEQLTDITVNPGTEALFESDYSTICADTEVVFTNLNIQSGVQYIWRWNDGEPNDTTTSETTLTHTFVNTSTTRAKQFEVELTAYHPASGCPSGYKQSVVVNPALDLQVSPDNSKGCAPLLVNFSNQSTNVATHRWFVREQGSSEKAQEQTVGEPQFTLDNQGGAVKLYEVVYVGMSAQGCADSTVHTIQVYPELQPDFTTDSMRVRLPNSTFRIENETPHAAAWTYHWDFGDGSSSTAVHPGAHTYATYGKYTITLTISNGLCSESYAQDVKVNEILPIVDFESIPVSGCGPLTVQFKNNSKYADPETFFWDFGDGEGYSSGVNPAYTYYKSGEYTVTLTASNPTGEVVSTSYAIVTVYGKPKVDFELRESVIYVPGEPLYVANYTIGGNEFIWDFGDGTEYHEFEPVHYYKEPGIYTITLTAINEWGCADSLIREEVVTAIAGGEAKIPNAFTPNSGGPNGGDVGAGNNDVFYPVLEGGVTRYNLKIYNRWGEMLFESNNRQIGWDGYYKGSMSKADVYVFKLSVEFSDGRKMEKLGDLTLIR